MLDYHIHLWPHPEAAVSEDLRLENLKVYCDQAQAQGVEEIALTEHFFRFRDGMAVIDKFWERDADQTMGNYFDAYIKKHCTAELDKYVEAVLKAKDAGLPVILGLEVDYYPGQMDTVAELLAGYPFDVLLGSIHWIDSWMLDHCSSELVLAEWDRRGTDQSWRDYTRCLEELAATQTCDVLAHPDLCKILGRRPPPALLDECQERMAEAAASSGMAAEVSSAGWRKPVGSAYPDKSLLDKFFEKGVPITTASDAHGSEFVGTRTDELHGIATGAGYDSLRAFKAREGRQVPLRPMPVIDSPAT